MNNYKNLIDRHHKYLRYLLVLSLITFVILFIASAANGAWYPDSNWQYRKKITIQAARVTGTHSSFPVLISLSTDAELAANARNDGYDILFTSDDEVTKIAHEREKFDGGTGELVAWVKVGSVSSGGNTDIYMYYGNLSASDQQQQAPTATEVWDSNYTAVWHLKETSGGADAIKDSTARANHGTDFNSPTFGVTGKIGNAVDFDGTADYVTMPTSGFNTSAGTVELWTNIDTFPSADNKYMFSHLTSPTANRVYVNLKPDNTWGTGMGDTYDLVRGSVVSAGTWYHLVLTWDGTNVRGYKDGALNFGPTSYSGLTTVGNIYVSAWDGTAEWFDGTLDEVRVSETVRSADWIQTEYNNQVWPNTADTPSPLPNPNPGGGFITVDTEVSGGGGGNQAPTVDAGAPKTITLPASANLSDASASDSDGPSGLTYTWIQVSVDPPGGTATFAPDNQELNPTVSFDQAGTYELKLSAYDGAATSEDTITITVNATGGGVGTPINAGDVAGYSCNMKITIDNTKVAFTSENFPVLISLTDASLKTSDCGVVIDPDGDDIVFTNSNLTLQLYHEIEKYDETTGEIVAWVLVPALSGSTDTDIYMYFGDSNVSSPTESPTDVWDSNYSMVYHLNEPSGTSGSDSVTDSTGNTGGTPSAGISFGQSGRVGNSVDFSSGTGISLGSIGSSLLAADATVSFWMYSNNVASPSRQNPFDQAYGGWGTMTLETNGVINWFFGSDGGNASPYGSHGSGSGLVTNGSWIYVVGVRNSSGYTYNWYKNGAYVTGSTYPSTYPVINTRTFTIGDGYVNPINGRIDEFRISNTPRSADWIQTEYNNQNDPSSFYSVEKNCPSTVPPISEFTCSIPLTIDSSKVSGTTDLTDFPVLISLTNTSLKTTGSCGYVENSNGYDIIFSDAAQTTRLDHEIEKYDGASGELVAWVRVPTLKYNEDTVINIHYGHSSVDCGDTENPTGVWDSNYKGVWHLGDTSGDTQDSTSYNTGGSVSGTVTRGATGQIGDAFDFYTDGEVDWEDPAHLDAGTGSWTVSLWANIDNNRGSGAWEKIINKGKGSNEPGYEMELDDTNDNLYFGINDGSTQWGESASLSFTEDTWMYVVGVVDRTTKYLRLYKDGDQVGTNYIGDYGNIDVGDSLTIGKSDWGWPDGRVDEVRLSNTARSADWIQTSYNNQNNPSSFYSVGASSCFLSGFSCNRRITIDSTKVAGSSDLTNFPFLLRIQNDCNLKTAANGGGVQNSSGWDIIFVDSDGVTQLDHEIEEYDGTTGDLTAWVRVPTLPYNSDKEIYMYYGKSGLACDPSNPTGVWQSSYEAVYHLNGDVKDSTSNGRDGYNDNTSAYASVIEDGRNFSPVDDFDIGTWGVSGQGLTMQAWARFDDFYQNDPRVFSKANSTSEQDHVFMLGLGGTGEQYLRMRLKTGTSDWSGTTTTVDTDDPLSSGNWYLIAGTYDGANMRMLVDGVQVHSAAKTGNMRVNSWEITVGNNPGSLSSTSYSMDGKLDEVRILSAARSANWLRTEYNNQSDPDSFYSMSQDTCGGEYGFNFQYCKKITVDHTQVSSSLTSYPLLINITGDDDLKTVANGGRVQNSQGYDIVFKTSGCVNYDYELEKYDGVNGDLVAWVHIPTLSSSTDTEIYMYYGATVICSPENPTAVWDARFRAVYHLNDDFMDSTQYNRDGTNYGATFTAGKIGNGALFDPSDGYDRIELGTWDMSSDDFTVQAWAWPNDFNQDDPRIVSKGSTTGSSTQDHVWQFGLENGDNGENRMRFRLKTGWDDALGTVQLTGSSPNGYLPTAQTWYHLAGTYEDDNSAGTEMRLYVNGLAAGQLGHAGNIRQNSWPVWIGANPHGASSGAKSWDGVLDEVRILSSDLSQAWLETEYLNHNDPGNFYSITSCFEQTTEVTQEWVEEVQ